MEKIIHISLYLAVFFTLITQNTFPQFVINSAFNPAPGDTLVRKSVNTAGITPGSSGINQTWNFQNIYVMTDTTVNYYVLTSSTPYANLFPHSNIAALHYYQKAVSYNFWETTGNECIFWGHYNNGSVANYQRADTFYSYSITYGTQYTHYFNAVAVQGNTVDYIWGHRNAVCDGSGTLILPSATYNNALRLKMVNEVYDTTRVGGTVTNISHYVETEYSWFCAGYKFPLFIFDRLVEGSSQYTFIWLTVKNMPVGIEQISSDIPVKYKLYQNYPNPFNPVTKIKFGTPPQPSPGERETQVRLLIYDIQGREIAVLVNENLKPGTYEVSWDASNYPSGVYFYRFVVSGTKPLTVSDVSTPPGINFSETKKMIIVK